MPKYKQMNWSLEEAKMAIEDVEKFGLADEYSPEEIAEARAVIAAQKKKKPAPKKKGLGIMKSVSERQKALDATME